MIANEARRTGRPLSMAVSRWIAGVALAWALQAASALAAVIFNPYAGVDWSTFGQYKGNLHTHTTQSDGNASPAAMIDAYRGIGYSILSLTDHDTHGGTAATTWPWTDFGRDPASLGMVAIQGNEISRPHHIGSYFNDYGDANQSSASAAIAEIGNRNGLAVLFHPGRYSESVSWYTDLYTTYDHLIGMEVYNQGDRYPGDRALWDQVLTQLMPHTPVWGFSNDDAHNATSHLGRNWNTFLLPELTEAAVRDAMVAGQFYFSYAPGGHPAGGGDPAPVINSIAVDEQAGTITIDASGATGISWISAGVEIASGVMSLDVSAHQGYVRAELFGSGGAKTYTQPFFVGDPDGGTPRPFTGASVGPDGVYEPFSFRPTTTDGWSTMSISGAPGDLTSPTALDATVQSLDARDIVTQVGSSGTWRPTAHALAQWNSSEGMLQIRPTGNAATVLMAALQNNTGDYVDDLHVWYHFGSWLLQENEHVYGHRTFYSLTGEPGSWQLIPELSEFSQTTAEGQAPIAATLQLGGWAPGAPLYLLWADDNGPGGSDNSGTGREGAYTINHFGATPRPPSWTTLSNDVLRMSHPDDTGHHENFANFFVGTGNQSEGRIELEGGHTFNAGSLTLVSRSHGGGAHEPHLLNVSGNNTWSSPIGIGETGSTLGTIESAAGSHLTLTGDIYASDGRDAKFLWLGGDGDGLLSGNIASNIRDLRKYGSGTWVLTGENRYWRDTIIDGGTLQVGDGGATGTLGGGEIAINSNGTLHIHRSGVLTFDDRTAGSGTVIQTGGHLLQLANTGNNFTGDWYVRDDSTLQVTTQSRLPRFLRLDGGHLVMTTTGETGLDSARRIIAEDGGGTINIVNSGGTLRISDDNRLTGSGDLALVGPGTLRIDNNINFSGDWYLQNGTLRVTTQSRLGADNISGGQSIFFDGGTLRFTDGNTTINASRTFVVQEGGGTFVTSHSSNPVILRDNQVTGTGALTKAGGGILQVGNNSGFLGSWVLEEGTLRSSRPETLGNNATVVFNGGNLHYTSGSDRDVPSGHRMVVEAGGGRMTMVNQITIQDNDLLSGTGTLALAGPGTLRVENPQPNFSGTWELRSGGTLQVLHDSDRIGGPGAAVLFDGGTLRLSNSSMTLDPTHSFTVADGGGTFHTTSHTLTLGTADQLRGSGMFQLTGSSGAGTLRIEQPQPNFTGELFLHDMILEFGGDDDIALGGLLRTGGSRTIHNVMGAGAALTLSDVEIRTTSSQTLTIDGSGDTVIAGSIFNSQGGASDLRKTGTGTLTLSGDNSYTGTIDIEEGVLRLAASGATGHDANVFTVGPNQNSTGRIELEGGHTFSAPDGSLRLVTRTYSGGNHTPHLVNVSGDNTWASPIGVGDSGSTLGIVESAVGTLTLAGDFFRIGGSDNKQLWLGGDGDGVVSGGIGSGEIRDLRKYGDGTWALTGANTYLGDTTIDQGTLLVNGTHTGGGAYTVHLGATLGGTGALDATVRIRAGGTHAPGASVGSQTVGGAVWDGGGQFEFEINDAAGTPGGPAGWDFLEVAGTLDLSGLGTGEGERFVIDIVSLAGTDPGQTANFLAAETHLWEFLRYEELVGEFSPSLFELRTDAFLNPTESSYAFQVMHLTDPGSAGGWLAIGYVPEPGTLLMALTALVLLLGRRRRR